VRLHVGTLTENPEGSSLPTVSVVVPTYNRRDFLPRVLAPLLADPATREVVVVVDGSSDGSYELLNELATDEPRLRPFFIENSGQTAAQEAGLRQATSDVVLLLDDDVVPEPGLVTGHARHHAASERLVVIGYMPTRVDEKRTSSSIASLLYAQEYERAVQRYLDDPEGILQGLWMGNISLRREDCLRVGLFNPEYASIAELYHVDRDFGLRCLKAGLTGVHDRSLRGTHFLVRSLSSFLKYAHAQGVGVVGLHRLHGDLLGPITLDSFTDDLSAPVRSFVRATRHRVIRRPVIPVLTGWIELAGMTRMTALQLPAARLARRIEQQRGALEAFARDA
jgi:glycosyltransferase involved in cell wall biosynthesis